MDINHAKRMLAHLERSMPNELQPLGNIPAHILARRGQRDPLAVTAIIGGGALPNRISTRDNRFTLSSNDGETIELPTLYLDCIIVGHNPNMSQMYYEGPYDREDATPPDCWADNGIGPSTNAAKPQAPTCAVCEKKKWGSATSKLTGKSIPACQSSRKLAVFFGETVYQLKVPPGSFNNWNSYIKYLAPQGSVNPLSYEDVITRVSFERTGVLKFEPRPNDPYVPAEAYEMMERIHGEQLYRDVLGLDDKPIGFEAGIHASKNSMMQTSPAPKMQPEFHSSRPPQPASELPEVTEPPKRRAKKVEAPQEVPAAPPSMADKVAEAFNFKFPR